MVCPGSSYLLKQGVAGRDFRGSFRCFPEQSLKFTVNKLFDHDFIAPVSPKPLDWSVLASPTGNHRKSVHTEKRMRKLYTSTGASRNKCWAAELGRSPKLSSELNLKENVAGLQDPPIGELSIRTITGDKGDR
ncbi:hypothetical protein HJG60_008753 [Phyllostomus discolor]|uniref:Uncharacterized protein n=1 Tax=Phyllostomus discolor TaxID=89673 RepID=A0A833YWF4_9CHIR|nr:hypothetical protein HJG60_008753 [Phyllostomus discolor]